MVFRQRTVAASDPARLSRFWARALGYQPVPPDGPDTTWHRHYRARLGGEGAFDDRIFDPAGLRPPIWFQEVPGAMPAVANQVTVEPRVVIGGETARAQPDHEPFARRMRSSCSSWTASR